jgi:hypothetical protein
MDQDPRQNVPEPIALRKSFQKLEIEDGERTPRFWERLWSRLGLKSKTKPKPGVRLRRMWPAATKDEKGPADHFL